MQNPDIVASLLCFGVPVGIVIILRAFGAINGGGEIALIAGIFLAVVYGVFIKPRL